MGAFFILDSPSFWPPFGFNYNSYRNDIYGVPEVLVFL